MIFYKNVDDEIQEISVTQVVLHILNDLNEKHLVSEQREGNYVDWRQIPAVNSQVEKLISTKSVYYVGPEMAGYISRSEMVLRILADPEALHLIMEADTRNNTHVQGNWVEWTRLRSVYALVEKEAGDIELPPPRTSRKDSPEWMLNAQGSIELYSKRRGWSAHRYETRWSAFERLEQEFDPRELKGSKKHLSNEAFYNWCSHGVSKYYFDFDIQVRGYIKKKLLQNGRLTLTGIGVLERVERHGQPVISFRAFPKFKAKLNGREPWSIESPIGGDKVENIQEWWKISTVRNKDKLSAFRQTSIEFLSPVKGSYVWRCYLEFIACYLWGGEHVLLPEIGSFRLRAEKYPNTFRSVRFRTLPSFIKEMKKDLQKKGEGNA